MTRHTATLKQTPICKIPEKWGDLNKTTKDQIEIEVYSDEINVVRLSADGSVWMYIGVLFVPLEFKERCLKRLNDLRCIEYNNWCDRKSECSHQCGFHDKNDTEIHYHSLHRSNARLRIAKNWIKFLSRESSHKNLKLLSLNILGLNLSNMNLGLFGNDTQRDLTIYNRFYRTALNSGTSYFFKRYRKVKIHKIYHDKGSQESHGLFPWHSIHKINVENKKVKVEQKEISFIDSDHRKSGIKESHFIQFVDLALGATFCCLHNPSEREQKKEFGIAFKPALKTILDRKKNQNDDYMEGSYYSSNYYRTQQISFFPKNKMQPDEALTLLDGYGNHVGCGNIKSKNGFYYDRPILLEEPSQSLDRWL